ncbi:MAG TPA: CpsD/CapB family tyrosine-protein kinase [Terriglobales bacterium]|jgi:capsular exopolysaccharide synthesis family protein
MGLFFTALERAEQNPAAVADEAPDKVPNQAPAAPGGPPAPVRTWEEAAQRDLAGYPLATPAASAIQPTAAVAGEAPAELRAGVEWDAASLGAAAVPSGMAKEQYRILRSRLLEAMHSRDLRTVLITSATPGEGKTMVAANLALQISALGEHRVLLIDADLRRAGLSASVRPAPLAGLGDYLKGDASLAEVLFNFTPWLSILPTRPTQDVAPELLSGQGMVELLQHARQSYDLVLLDGAPVGPVADSRILARLADAALLVVRADTAPTEEIARAAEMLRPRLLGSVLNGAQEKPRRGYGSGYYDAPATPAEPADVKEPA